MRVVVAGDFKTPVLLNTNEATAVLIETDDGQPAVILRMLPNGKGFIRLFKGEDEKFDDTARQLGLKPIK
jgi:hypothetical protein